MVKAGWHMDGRIPVSGSTLSEFGLDDQGYQIDDRNYPVLTGIISGIFLFLLPGFRKT